MIEIRDLSSIPLPALAEAFNDAFSDYFIDVQLSAELLEFKVAAEDIRLDLSPGAFEGDRLLGFMLQGSRGQTAYNAGTGVRPPARRKGLVRAMHAWAIPRLRAARHTACILEVIDINAPALGAYLREGYQKTRRLDIFIGQAPEDVTPPAGYSIRFWEELPDEAQLQAMQDYAPTWQHQTATARNTWERQGAFGIEHAGQTVGYAIYTPYSGRVLQWAIAPAHRGKGLGRVLVAEMQRWSEAPLRFVNVEEQPKGPGEFLHHLGLRRVMSQWEMRLAL